MTATARPARPGQAKLRALNEFDLTRVASHLLRRAHFRAEGLFAQAFPDEDLSELPGPEVAVPGFRTLIEGTLPSGRYRAQELVR